MVGESNITILENEFTKKLKEAGIPSDELKAQLDGEQLEDGEPFVIIHNDTAIRGYREENQYVIESIYK